MEPKRNENISYSGYYPIAALIAVQALFGSLPVIAKVVLVSIPAASLVGFRVGIAAAVLFTVQLFRRRIWLNDRRDYVKLAVLSLFGVTLNQMFFIGGLSITKASNTSLLAITIPIFTLIVSAAIGNERSTWLRLSAFCLRQPVFFSSSIHGTHHSRQTRPEAI